MNRPLIGVLALIDYIKESYRMLPGYMDGISDAGGLPVMLPVTDDADMLSQIAEECDGFLFTGGHDVSPSIYGAKSIGPCVEISPERDMMEQQLFKMARAADKPVLGICRGIQFINAVMGGDLWQDLPTQRPSNTEHHQHAPYDVSIHLDRVINGTPLYDLLSDILVDDMLPVNSYHHQAVRTVAPALEVMAVSEDGLTEAVYDPSQTFMWAVQWHPEFSYKTDESARRIFRAFVKACKKSGKPDIKEGSK